jgi:hypothetical protein
MNFCTNADFVGIGLENENSQQNSEKLNNSADARRKICQLTTTRLN